MSIKKGIDPSPWFRLEQLLKGEGPIDCVEFRVQREYRPTMMENFQVNAKPQELRLRALRQPLPPHFFQRHSEPTQAQRPGEQRGAEPPLNPQELGHYRVFALLHAFAHFGEDLALEGKMPEFIQSVSGRGSMRGFRASPPLIRREEEAVVPRGVGGIGAPSKIGHLPIRILAVGVDRHRLISLTDKISPA
ncbi:MAG: hypothetical protein ACLQU5_14210 [Isosphaeraceae bacterium]